MKISPLGVYKAHADQDAYEEALSAQGDQDYVRRELGSLVLVEIRVEGADRHFDIAKLKQAHTEYVPYAEEYFDLEGNHLGHQLHQNLVPDFIVLFYLHFYEPNKPLQTPIGPILLPEITPVPERLSWKKYMYWD